MLVNEDIANWLNCQQYVLKRRYYNDAEKKETLVYESTQTTANGKCPYCNSKVYADGYGYVTLKDMPYYPQTNLEKVFVCHRYECMECGRKHTESIPQRHPGTRITERAAQWIQGMLRHRISIRAIQGLTGIHWETIRNLHLEIMERTLEAHKAELKAKGYHPKFLAVDEFALHKGHTYATCVMDLQSGEVLWVGKDRSKVAFEKFFEETDPSFLSEVRAVAMDMNASYYLLVKQYMPHAEIVYDRYHMQAQFGKDVLGVVRLSEAKAHKDRALEIKESLSNAEGEDRDRLKKEAKYEQHQYSQIKKLRWPLLAKAESLSDAKAAHLADILETHSDLAVCYAMKEEMSALFNLRDPEAAKAGWEKWFVAAKESNIPALVRFAELKEKRIDGLISHAVHPISTGRLEGFNNTIKVAKRIAYGYRDHYYFFTLIKFQSLAFPKYP